MYEGAVNDVTALSDILHAMTNAGFDLDKNILVTDRGYSSLENIQKMINLDLKYLQGVRFVEDSLKQNFERHKESLRKNAFFSSKEKAYAFTLKEPWSQNTDYGRLKLDTYVHLFRLVNREDETAVFLSEKADEIIRLKNETSLFHRIFGTTTGDLLIQLKIQTGIVNGFENQAKSMRRSKRRGILLLEATAFPMRLKRFPFIGSAGWLSRISIN